MTLHEDAKAKISQTIHGDENKERVIEATKALALLEISEQLEAINKKLSKKEEEK